jgi:TPR repeat protein
VNTHSGFLSTPLHSAAIGCYTNEARYVAVVKVLLGHRADVNARMRWNRTPLHCAALWGHPQILQVLLAAGADPTARDDNGYTALDLAVATGWPGLPPDVKERPLLPAVVAGRKACAELLRGNRQKETGDALNPKTSQNTNAPPEKVQDNRQAVSEPEPLATLGAKVDRQTLAQLRAKAEKGDAVAQFNLGVCYDNGQGVAKDKVETVKWYRKAAEQNCALAQSDLGVCYGKGRGVAKDEVEAVKWYRKAAEQNDAKAQNNLGVSYGTGTGVAKDVVEALKWLRKAVEQNYALAQNNLAGCYAEGRGVAKDEVEAVKWYRKAAEQNLAVAQSNLGLCYVKGQGVAKDKVEAVKWFRKAAEQNHANAQYNLCLCCYSGDGVVKHYVEAYKWGLLASARGDEAAKRIVSVLEDTMTREQIAEGQEMAGVRQNSSFRLPAAEHRCVRHAH